jgi:hypothetical protein
MGGLRDIAKFEKFNFKDMAKKIKDDPERLFIGAGDEVGSKFWGKVTGKDYEPIVNQWGGASDGAYQRAEQSGINTKAGRRAHDVAEAIAAYYVLNGGSGGGSPEAGGASGAGGYQEAGGGFVGNGEYLGSSGGAGGGAFNWQQFAKGIGGMGGQQQPQEPVEQDRWKDPTQYRLEGDLQMSSRSLKKGLRASDAPIQRGARGLNDIDANGVQIAAIKELSQRITALRKRIDQCKGAHHG